MHSFLDKLILDSVLIVLEQSLEFLNFLTGLVLVFYKSISYKKMCNSFGEQYGRSIELTRASFNLYVNKKAFVFLNPSSTAFCRVVTPG